MLTFPSPATCYSIMTAFCHVESHPKYTDVVSLTVSEEQNCCHRQHRFSYKNDVFSWIPSFLLPKDFYRIRNDSFFYKEKNEIHFTVQPDAFQYYKLEGCVLLTENEQGGVDVRVRLLSIDTFQKIPSWLDGMLENFILHQIEGDLQCMVENL